ncbi:hypothetical protein ACH427_09100 [Streptomyces sp. NPDC020379]|uniref:hypothetical protein n=1 Tax=Streptomyces sp. NPDC020379 TaxID=3365071 RepID=UPI0037973A67
MPDAGAAFAPDSITGDNETAVAGEINAWLAAHAPARIIARGAPPDLVERVRRLGLPFESRWG